MSTDLMNISAFKGLAPSAAFKAALDPQSESLADGIGSSYGIIGYKGKVWTLRLRGESYQFKRPDDGTPAPFLDVIIIRQLPNKSKSYYAANSYQEGSVGTRPICASLDGVTPDADIAAPQSNACAICPRNVFKVTPDGRKTRECSDFKRLAVLILPSLTRPLLGAALMEPVFLRVPPASLNDLAMLGDGMSSQGFHYSSYITRIGFNPDKPHPQMVFRALMALTDKEAPLVLPLREDPIAYRITGESDLGKPRPAAIVQQPVQQMAPQGPQPVTNVTPIRPQPVQQPVDTGFADLTAAVNGAPMAQAALRQAAKPVQQEVPFDIEPVKPVQQEVPFDTGFGEPIIVPQAQPIIVPQAQPVVNNVAADTGIAEDADTDLDARVAALLQR